ncbi:MAG TPA: transposase [Ignavibacteria bacterium]|nr:transposase [Ignavibacteria bacterium]
MKYKEGNIYHIFNQGINYQRIFFKNENYLYFLDKIRKYLKPNCEILSYSLIPNQFQILIYSKGNSSPSDFKERNKISEGFRLLLSSYTKGINKQEYRTGSLFTQNTKSRFVDLNDCHAEYCLNFIHQSPLRKELVSNIDDWEFSSFKEYCGNKNEPLCNIELTAKLLSIDFKDFRNYSNQVLKDEIIQKYFKNIEKVVPHL